MLSIRPSYQSVISVFQQAGPFASAGAAPKKRSTPTSVPTRGESLAIDFKRWGRSLRHAPAGNDGKHRVQSRQFPCAARNPAVKHLLVEPAPEGPVASVGARCGGPP